VIKKSKPVGIEPTKSRVWAGFAPTHGLKIYYTLQKNHIIEVELRLNIFVEYKGGGQILEQGWEYKVKVEKSGAVS
jgi:hypothetical protein